MLREVPLAEVLPPIRGMCYVTCSPGQWDGLLAGAYAAGWTLIEVDDDERPARAYRRPDSEAN
jgi:hypothetical protein